MRFNIQIKQNFNTKHINKSIQYYFSRTLTTSSNCNFRFSNEITFHPLFVPLPVRTQPYFYPPVKLILKMENALITELFHSPTLSFVVFRPTQNNYKSGLLSSSDLMNDCRVSFELFAIWSGLMLLLLEPIKARWTIVLYRVYHKSQRYKIPTIYWLCRYFNLNKILIYHFSKFVIQ